MKKDYCLYIEPYTHIESQKNNILFYNTFNGQFLKSDEKIIVDLFKDIKKNKNLHFISVTKKELEQDIISNFFKKLRDLFMCEYIYMDFLLKTPVIIKSESKITDSLSDIKPTQFSLSNISFLNSHLKEITIITNNLVNVEPNLNTIYFQTASNSEVFNESKYLSNDNINKIISIIKSCPIDYINIVGSNIFEYSNINKLFEFLNKVDVVKILNLSYNNLVNLIKSREYKTWIKFFKKLDNKFSIINIIIDLPLNGKDFNLIKSLKNHLELNLEFQFLIEKEDDVKYVESLINEYVIENSSLLPYYNGKNLDFFKKNVFLTEDDIMDIPPHNSKDLLIKSTINSNYFGKLIFMSNGDIYSNIHSSKVGNLADNKLHEIIYREIDNGNWVFTRKKANPCKECIYNIFCPPINKYEFDLSKNNLCHFWN